MKPKHFKLNVTTYVPINPNVMKNSKNIGTQLLSEPMLQ